MNKLTVVDFFCGAGGFSEGFRQRNFDIIRGYDNWKPAIETFNYNFEGNKAVLQNILSFKNVDLIDEIPNSDVILGSPPCVSFSSSNNSGKADKSLGVELIETFLKIVAVKKFQPNSILKAFFMENVAKSLKYLPESYSFIDLNLSDWAIQHNITPSAIAIKIAGNHSIINSADYGSPQIRKRAIVGEIIGHESLPIPVKTHSEVKMSSDLGLKPYNVLKDVRYNLPEPNNLPGHNLIRDPLYCDLSILDIYLSDHYYDTGLYECEWKNSKFLKTNHPYMGKMSFPENENRPSRTITATKIGTSREALIFRSEYHRTGNGEFRTPTVREAACLMSFPITYQFMGSIGTKWRLVGNAVCPSVSRAFATELLRYLNLSVNPEISFEIEKKTVKKNLNSFQEAVFDNIPKRKPNSKFRRHPFKEGNMTVTFSNYDILNKEETTYDWRTSAQYGNGDGFPSVNYPNGFFEKIEPIIETTENGLDFIYRIKNNLVSKIGSKKDLQDMYENQKGSNDLLEPTELVEYIANIIEQYDFKSPLFQQDDLKIFNKDIVPKKQLFALYALNKVSSIANRRVII